jgi:hypothetical protein
MSKQIKLLITAGTSTSDIISSYHELLPDQYRLDAEYEVVNTQVMRCIEDYVKRLQSLARAGTTINISSEFTLGDIVIVITLQHPTTNISFLNKMKRLLMR